MDFWDDIAQAKAPRTIDLSDISIDHLVQESGHDKWVEPTTVALGGGG